MELDTEIIEIASQALNILDQLSQTEQIQSMKKFLMSSKGKKTLIQGTVALAAMAVAFYGFQAVGKREKKIGFKFKG